MSNSEPRWDIGEQIVQRSRSVRPLSGVVAASMANVVFGVLVMGSASAAVVQMSDLRPALKVIRVDRKDIEKVKPELLRDGSDTRQGISTGRLANLFPVLFEECEPDEDSEPFLVN